MQTVYLSAKTKPYLGFEPVQYTVVVISKMQFQIKLNPNAMLRMLSRQHPVASGRIAISRLCSSLKIEYSAYRGCRSLLALHRLCTGHFSRRPLQDRLILFPASVGTL